MIARAALSIRRGRALAPAAAPAAGRTRRSPGTSPAAATARAVAGGDRSTGTGSRTDHEPKHYFGCKRFRPGVSVTAIATHIATRNKGRERRGEGMQSESTGCADQDRGSHGTRRWWWRQYRRHRKSAATRADRQRPKALQGPIGSSLVKACMLFA